MSTQKIYADSFEFMSKQPRGHLSLRLNKSLETQRDLSLAYTPGIAGPCMEIARDPMKVWECTSKGNFVAIITNGTAVLGLGNIGAMASKPVMEGKAALFKRFAGVDAVDIEVETEDVAEFINIVQRIGKTWGGINLEDIKAPECFIIEEKLKELLDIPVFHDDQHGTAIVAAAALTNALEITNKQIQNTRIIINGAGAAGIACAKMFLSLGIASENLILCDTKGVIYKGREQGINPWKVKYANDTNTRTLEEAIAGADVFFGVSRKEVLTDKMLLSMARNPIVFALANPEPEILPQRAISVRSDVIIATGRSDFNNQINNVMAFPHIFRGALDTQASTINEEMKVAAAQAIAKLAKAGPTNAISTAYPNKDFNYGPNYILPVPLDIRLLTEVSTAVVLAAMKTNIANKKIEDIELYRAELSRRLQFS